MSEEFDPREFLNSNIHEIELKVNEAEKHEFEMDDKTEIEGITVEEYTVLRLYFKDGLSYVDVFVNDVNLYPESAVLHYFPQGIGKHFAYEITDDDMIERIYMLISDVMEINM